MQGLWGHVSVALGFCRQAETAGYRQAEERHGAPRELAVCVLVQACRHPLQDRRRTGEMGVCAQGRLAGCLRPDLPFVPPLLSSGPQWVG